MQIRIFQFIAWACLSSASLVACGGGDDSTGTTTGTGGTAAGTGGTTNTGGTNNTGGGTSTGAGGLASTGCYTGFNYSGYTAGATARTLKADVQPIFATSCALGGCHLAGGTQHPLLGPALGVAASDADLATIKTEIAKKSTEATAITYVTASQPENSWLMLKLDQDPAPCNTPLNVTCPLGALAACGRMPQTMPTGLPAATLSIIRDWIKQGAN